MCIPVDAIEIVLTVLIFVGIIGANWIALSPPGKFRL